MTLWIPPCAALQVAVVVGERGGVHAEVAQAIVQELGAAAKVSVHETATVTARELEQASLLVAVGAQAAAELAARPRRAPLLVTLVPRQGFERLALGLDDGAAPLSAIHLDQPLRRQLALIRLALPGTKRIGILLGPTATGRESMLTAHGSEYGFRIETRLVKPPERLASILLELLPEVDLLLALPDPEVYNADTVQMILLAAYRHQRPLIGFSSAYTRAGAVLSLYSTPWQIGVQAADMLRTALATGRLPPPRYPQSYRIAVNAHVARSLGLRLDDEQTLLQRLRQQE